MPIAQLDDRAIVRVAGPDAAILLQSVITADMGTVAARGSAYGALLTPQGKVLFDFVVHALDDGYGLDVRTAAAEAFAKRLAVYRLRAKVEIAAAPELAVFAAWPGLPDRPADPRLAALGSRFLAAPGAIAVDAAAVDWHRDRIRLAVPEGGVDFVFGDAFPHDAAMDALNGIAFEKGCFVGQEVVSRMRHRSTARRRIVALRSPDTFPAPGTDIVAGGQVLGRLGTSADGHGIGVARLDRLASAREAGLPLRSGDARLTVSLPDWATYSWPPAAMAGE